MEKFMYLTSEDHAKWYVADPSSGIDVSTELLDSDNGVRYTLREWIGANCRGRVYAWNKTVTPQPGTANWGPMIAPQGGVVMHFENHEDSVLFRLTWL